MDIFVYADWQGLNGPTMMGTLNVTRTKGHGVFSFEYHKDWIKQGKAQDLDPDLQHYSGPQYLGKDKPNFGVFMDSSPDRYGGPDPPPFFRKGMKPAARCLNVSHSGILHPLHSRGCRGLAASTCKNQKSFTNFRKDNRANPCVNTVLCMTDGKPGKEEALLVKCWLK